ncbi:MAG: methyl-accepting chemotaxis protein [Alphaproteobacteria bacterium]|nr:methyl-accepting chemotaxis protein [Rhodospirillales bacterium]MCW9046252.1 methyl-accepting chemotaxis protein [Alphaproteobacteria bacterium]
MTARSTDKLVESDLPLTTHAQQIRLHIVQVKQWLTDVSATRGLSGLTDGFIKAETHANLTLKEVSEAIKLAEKVGDKKILEGLKEVEANFPAYYSDGLAMAKAYVTTGPEGGNKLMRKFDSSAEDLGASVNHLSELVTKSSSSNLSVLKEMNNEALEMLTFLKTLVAIVSAIAVTFVLYGGIFLYRTISSAINYLKSDIESTSQKRPDPDMLLKTDRKDEFGDIATSLRMFRDRLVELDRETKEKEKRRAERAVESRNLMEELAYNLENAVGHTVKKVANASKEMTGSATSLSTMAKQTAIQASTVAAASEQATANVQTVASAAEQLVSSQAEISQQVTRSSRIVGGAANQAKKTRETVSEMVIEVEQIGQVVSLITDIAEQTNLLALNATIEAARAGDAGKGFAVVASEVKNLANQTAKATEEISGQIGKVQNITKEAANTIGEINTTILEVDAIANAITGAIEEQSAATWEIARNVDQAAQGTQEVSSNIIEVTNAADQNGIESSQILAHAQELSKESGSLSSEVNLFISKIRAS